MAEGERLQGQKRDELHRHEVPSRRRIYSNTFETVGCSPTLATGRGRDAVGHELGAQKTKERE